MQVCVNHVKEDDKYKVVQCQYQCSRVRDLKSSEESLSIDAFKVARTCSTNTDAKKYEIITSCIWFSCRCVEQINIVYMGRTSNFIETKKNGCVYGNYILRSRHRGNYIHRC